MSAVNFFKMIYYMSNIFGIHIDDNYIKLIDEVNRVKKMGCNLVQLFVDPFIRDKKIYELFKHELEKNKMHCVVHASYTINLANDWDEYSVWIKQLITEIEASHIIGAFGIVVHMGKQLNLLKEQAINNMYSSFLYIHNKTIKYKDVKIILETSTGQGSEMFFRLEDFAKFFKKFSHNKNGEIRDRVKICIDTCHIFSTGYDIRTKNTISMYLDTFEELIGIKHVALIHLNDTKTMLGSNIDRHQSLGKGYIGEKGLKMFAKFFIKLGVPIILETPPNYHQDEVDKFLRV